MSCMVGVLTVACAAIMAGVALLLPPFSLANRLIGTATGMPNGTESPGSDVPTALQFRTEQSGLTEPDTLGIRVHTLAHDVFLAGHDLNDARLQHARRAFPRFASLVGEVYWLERAALQPFGESGLSLVLTVPEDADAATIDVYGFDPLVGQWEFVPATSTRSGNTTRTAAIAQLPDAWAIALFRVPIPVPTVSVVIEPGQALSPTIEEIANTIHPAGLKPITSGALQGALPAGIAFGAGYAVVPVIRNFDGPGTVDVETISAVLRSPAFRGDHIQSLVEFAGSQPYRGLAIDYRELPADLRGVFTEFVSALAVALHRSNHTLTVVLPFPEVSGERVDTGAYDWAAIGSAADMVEVLLPLAPPLYSTDGVVVQTLAWAVGQISRARIQVALNAQCIRQSGESIAPLSLIEALSPLGTVTADPTGVVAPTSPITLSLSGEPARFEILEAVNTPIIRYLDEQGDVKSTVWLTTVPAFRERIGRILRQSVAGVVIPDLAMPGVPTGILDALAEFRVSQGLGDSGGVWLVPQAVLPIVRWRVFDGPSILIQQTGTPDDDVTFVPTVTGRALRAVADMPDLAVSLGETTVVVAAATQAPPTGAVSQPETGDPTSMPAPSADPPLATQVAPGS